MWLARFKSKPPKNSQYGHYLFDRYNKRSAEIFRLQGYHVIDLTAMIGMRTDAHPGYCENDYENEGDLLHFCPFGVPDVAVDQILLEIFGF